MPIEEGRSLETEMLESPAEQMFNRARHELKRSKTPGLVWEKRREAVMMAALAAFGGLGDVVGQLNNEGVNSRRYIQGGLEHITSNATQEQSPEALKHMAQNMTPDNIKKIFDGVLSSVKAVSTDKTSRKIAA